MKINKCFFILEAHSNYTTICFTLITCDNVIYKCAIFVVIVAQKGKKC